MVQFNEREKIWNTIFHSSRINAYGCMWDTSFTGCSQPFSKQINHTFFVPSSNNGIGTKPAHFLVSFDCFLQKLSQRLLKIQKNYCQTRQKKTTKTRFSKILR